MSAKASLNLEPGEIVEGPLISEPMRVERIRAAGPNRWVVDLVGFQTEKLRSVTLTASDLQQLRVRSLTHTFTGDGALLHLGLEAYALGIAYEFDPYFGLSWHEGRKVAHYWLGVDAMRGPMNVRKEPDDHQRGQDP